MSKMIFYFAGARMGKDCNPQDAVGLDLNIMSTFYIQRLNKGKNRLMLRILKQRKIERKRREDK